LPYAWLSTTTGAATTFDTRLDSVQMPDRLIECLMTGPESGRIFVGTRDSYQRGRQAAEAAAVEAPTLHECRHGYAALMIAAGVNVKALSTFMGHANIRITLDQYGHLLPRC
jgi:integrase